MHLWLLAAVNPALRLPPTTHLSPVMRADDLPRVEQGRPTGDRFSGGSVPFAGDQVNPASARAANRAARASMQSSTEPDDEFWTMNAESDGPNPNADPASRPAPGARQQRNADAPPPVESGRATGDRFSGGSVPFAPIGTAGGGSSATGSALPRQRARDDFEVGRPRDAPPPIEQGVPWGDKHSGGAVPFAPLGTAGGASDPKQETLSGRGSGQVYFNAQRTKRAPKNREKGPPPIEQGVPWGDKFCGGAVPFAPLGSAGGASAANQDALYGGGSGQVYFNTARTPRQPGARRAVGRRPPIDANAPLDPAGLGLGFKRQRSDQQVVDGGVSGSALEEEPMEDGSPNAPMQIGDANPGSLVAKKNAVAYELGLGGTMVDVAVGAAQNLGIDPTGKTAAAVIDECYAVMFE